MKRKVFIAMPLLSDMQIPNSNDWVPTTCPMCSKECWSVPTSQVLNSHCSIEKLCTSCMKTLK